MGGWRGRVIGHLWVLAKTRASFWEVKKPLEPGSKAFHQFCERPISFNKFPFALVKYNSGVRKLDSSPIPPLASSAVVGELLKLSVPLFHPL